MLGSAPRPIFDTLTHTRATQMCSTMFNDELKATLWHRQHLENTHYQRPGHHTLSFYLAGGFDICRRNQPNLRGAPGKFCILPAQHESDWLIGGEIRFLHLYFSEALFADFTVQLLDCEPRERQLLERTYIDDPVLAQLCHKFIALDWRLQDGKLSGHALAHEVLAHLIMTQTNRPQQIIAKGGLAPRQRRSALEMIEAHLDTPLTVATLAQELGLSEYHFARMFKSSLGFAPHAWICRRRLERARQTLRDTRLPLADVAAACGFSNASHLVNRFRAAYGVTPSQYRHWANN